MSSFHYHLYCLIISAIRLFLLCSSQSTICIWDSVDTRDHLNGEYALSGTQLNEPYWQKISISCAPSTYYIMYAEDKYGFWWFIDDELTSSYSKTGDQPYCESTPSDPTQCTGWFWWSSNGQNGAVPISVSNGVCPSLQCNKIELTNTGHAQCNKIFTKNQNMDNVFVNGDTFLYFNKQTFKWYCSNTLGTDECDNDENINHFYVSSQNDEWIDVAIDYSFQLRLSNGNLATFKCMGPTSAPTPDPITPTTSSPVGSTNTISKDPTNAPTKDPIKDPSKDPTIDPTIDPTKHPTIDPTNHPTSDPTNHPTSDPTNHPTSDPTNHPTSDPTNYPTKDPTNNPTKAPTNDPTEDPTKDPTKDPTNDPTSVSSYHSTKHRTAVPIKSTATAVTKTGDIVVVITPDPEKEDVVHDITTETPVNGVSDKKGDSNTENGIFVDMLIVYILAASLLFVVILTACIVFIIYRRKKKKNDHEGKDTENKTNINQPIQMRVASMEMSSVNLSELCVATTPNLTPFNRTMSSNMIPITPITPMGEENPLECIDDILPITPGRLNSVASLVSVDSNIIHDQQQNTEEGGDDDDELYTAVPRQITIGGTSGIDEPVVVTKGYDNNKKDEDDSVEESHDQIYTKPDEHDIVTAGNDDDI